MSVPKSQRNEGEMSVITLAKNLVVYTMRMCSNEAYFPKRYRWCLASKMVEAAVEISNYITKANSVYVKDDADYSLRKSFQTQAIANTYSLLSMIQIAYQAFGIEKMKVEQWTGLTVEVQNKLRNWRKSDSDRYMKR